MAGDATPRGATPRSGLTAADLRRWARLVASRLDAARAELDALNVFPVPDGDTGTNLALTVRGAVAEGGDDLARALLVHARGNSGVIASQLVRGWADVMDDRGGAPVGPELVAKALRRGDDLAWAAVTDPVEGTVLSVSRAAAEAAEQAATEGTGLPGMVAAVVRAAEQALARTPLQLPVLAAAGVVDAGGAGLLVALRALRDVVTGTDDEGPDGRDGPDGPDGPGGSDGVGADHVGSRLGVAGVDLDPSGPAYEVMYLLEPAGDDAVEGLREALGRLGDSVLVVGGNDLRHVHVHTDDPGAAVEAGLAAGTPSGIRITHFAAAQAQARVQAQAGVQARSTARATAGPSVSPQPGRPRRSLAVVACAAGRATEEVCRAAGATVVTSAPGARASTGDVLDAVLAAGLAAGADRVLVLPNDSESAAVAHQATLAAEEQGVTAVVSRSRSQVQVLAALAVLGPGGGLDGQDGATGGRGDRDVAALASAAAAVEGCRYGAVAVAGRAMDTAAGRCAVGDLVGTVGREVVALGDDPVDVAARVVAHLGERVELVTVVPGEGAGDAATRLQERLTAEGLAVEVVGGGQPRYVLLLGCE